MRALTAEFEVESAAAEGDSVRLPFPFVLTPLARFAAPLAAPRGTSLSELSLDSIRGAILTSALPSGERAYF